MTTNAILLQGQLELHPDDDALCFACVEALQESGMSFGEACSLVGTIRSNAIDARTLAQATHLLSAESGWEDVLLFEILDVCDYRDGQSYTVTIVPGESAPAGRRQRKREGSHTYHYLHVTVGAVWLLETHKRLEHLQKEREIDGPSWTGFERD